ncbi:MAG: polysulfide reductase NrfD [Desulfurococcales archaeon]|nr:polysulfide reductase NrfD [Desulfurococcales archaeon]
MELVFVPQTWWEWVIAGYLFLGGMCGTAIPVAYYFWHKQQNRIVNLGAGLVSFIGMVLGIILLVIDLGRPQNVIHMFISPRLNLTSWMTIGTYIISIYTILAIYYAIQFTPRLNNALGALKLKHGNLKALGILTSFFGLSTAAYTGFLLSAAKGVQFWNNPILPILFITSGLSAGLGGTYCGIVSPILRWKMPEAAEKGTNVRIAIQKFESYVLLAELFILFAYLDIAKWSYPGSVKAADTILTGSLAPVFWIGVVILGIIIPFILLTGYTLRIREETLNVEIASFICGWLVIIGGLLLRYIILTAGVIPVPLI